MLKKVKTAFALLMVTLVLCSCNNSGTSSNTTTQAENTVSYEAFVKDDVMYIRDDKGNAYEYNDGIYTDDDTGEEYIYDLPASQSKEREVYIRDSRSGLHFKDLEIVS